MLASIIFEIENMRGGHVKKPQSLYFWCFGGIPFLSKSFWMNLTHIFLLQKWKKVVIMSAASD